MAKYIHVVLRMPKQEQKLLIYAKTVLDLFEENPHFPSPDPPLPVFRAHVEKLDGLETEAARRIPGAPTARDAAREVVRQDVRHLGDHVETVVETAACGADLLAIRAMVESVGMDLRKIPTRPRLVFAATPGAAPGSVDLTAPASDKGDTHEWQHRSDAQDWIWATGTRQARTTIKGLATGVQHAFRHRLLTKDGPTEWCEPIVLTLK
jgi:hypothetical protein